LTPRPARSRTPSGEALAASVARTETSTAAARPARDQVVDAGLPAGTALIQVRVVVCLTSSPATGFALTDDLQVGSLEELPEGCRPADPGEVAVRFEGDSADGLPASTSLIRTGVGGAVSITVPVGAAPRTVRLTAASSGGNIVTTVSLRAGQSVALDLTVFGSADALTARPLNAALDTGWTGTVSGGAVAAADRSVESPANWYAVVLLLLTTTVVAAYGLRQIVRR